MRFWLCLAVAVSARPQTLPPVDQLVRDALERQARAYSEMTEYTYSYQSTSREFDEKGKLRRQEIAEGESYQSAYRNVDVEQVRNGKPLSRRAAQKRQREAAQQLQRDYERRLREQEKKPIEFGATIGNLRMETFATLRLCPLSNLRRDTLNGRAVYALDFGPAPPGTAFPRKGLGHLTRTRGTVWIDAEDGMISQWKAWSTAGGGLFFDQRWLRVEPRVWSGGRLHVNFNAAPELFDGDRREWIWELTNPRKFSVAVDQKIAEPPR